MIRFQDLQEGDIVMAEYEGQQREGVVTDLNREDKEVCIETDVQEFWFSPDQLHPIPLSEERLFRLGFAREEMENGIVKYMKDSFRLKVPNNGKFYPLEIWWREDHRLLADPIAVHELQNHYYDMTKVELNAV